MALHPIKLPKSAAYLFRIVVLQKKLFKALCNPAVDANAVDMKWVQNVWSRLDPEWVQKFCRGRSKSILQPLKAVAGASLNARIALYEEFYRQSRVPRLFKAGGDFRDLSMLTNFDAALVTNVTIFFKRSYELLSNNDGAKWKGYELPGNRTITNRSYKDEFCEAYPTKVVCPYCDGEIGTPELDHYLAKSKFPLLACSPWNLVPVCRSCNNVVVAKGDRPAITLGPPRSTVDWLHPFFRPASDVVQIRLNGSPHASIPQLYSSDAAEQTRLGNHADLIQTLSKRWTKLASAYFDVFVREVNKKLNAAITVDSLVRTKLEDHVAARGRSPSSLIQAAVCQAVLDRRPEYLEEFAFPNPPVFHE